MDSTPQVDFYLLSAAGVNDRLHFACRLVEKAYDASVPVFAAAASPEEAQRLDTMLWTFRQSSFIPHELADRASGRAPVTIGTLKQVPAAGELLINLTDAMPEQAAGFRRVAEILTDDQAVRSAGRERYRQYLTLGATPQTHTIG